MYSSTRLVAPNSTAKGKFHLGIKKSSNHTLITPAIFMPHT